LYTFHRGKDTHPVLIDIADFERVEIQLNLRMYFRPGEE